MEAPFDQKTAALMSRINFRDLFDLAFVLAFVMESHGNTLRSGQIRRADALLAGWKRFASRFSDAFERDEILPDPATLDTTLLGFRRVIAAQLRLLRVPGNQRDPLAGEVGQRGRRHVAAVAPDEDQPVLEIRLRVNQPAFALRVLPEGRAPVELAAQQ